MFAHLLASILSVFALVGASTPPTPAEIPAVDVVAVVPTFGEFRVRIDRNSAPNHVAHFLSLAASRQYDGSLFHRVIPGFIVQSGRDSASAQSDPAVSTTRIPDERSSLPAVRGAFVIAWRGCTPGTGSREWYVCVADLPKLESCGTVIGNVVSGMEVIDKIAQVSTTPQWSPLRPIVLQNMKIIPATEPVPQSASKPLSDEDSTDGGDSEGGDSPPPK
jgi:cyclophilin family peptidyl-prolyl cis-trans isomerase